MDSWNQNITLYPHDRIFAKTLEPYVPRWLKPNHITAARFLLTPVVLFFLARGNYNIGVPLFVITALTDAIDGSLARTRKQITAWGTLYDPLADKLLVGLVLFVIVLEHINRYLGFGILGFELAAIAGSMIRKARGRVEPANVWGKSKMFAEVLGIGLLLLALWINVDLLVDFSTGVLAVALVAAILSFLVRLR